MDPFTTTTPYSSLIIDSRSYFFESLSKNTIMFSNITSEETNIAYSISLLEEYFAWDKLSEIEYTFFYSKPHDDEVSSTVAPLEIEPDVKFEIEKIKSFQATLGPLILDLNNTESLLLYGFGLDCDDVQNFSISPLKGFEYTKIKVKRY